MDAAPRRRLRWYQYSLRSLFLLTVLVAIGGSWFAVKRQQVEKQRAAVKAVQQVYGRVTFDWQKLPMPIVRQLVDGGVEVTYQYPDSFTENEPPGPLWLRRFLGDDFFARPVGVFLFESWDTDTAFEHVDGLESLQWLVLSYSRITDDGLEHLHGLTQLQHLDLQRTNVTDEGVKKLQEALPNCNIVR